MTKLPLLLLAAAGAKEGTRPKCEEAMLSALAENAPAAAGDRRALPGVLEDAAIGDEEDSPCGAAATAGEE